MGIEKKLVEYIVDARFDDLPKEPVETMKAIVLTILGTTIAGATTDGCEAIVHRVKDWGGKKEATILIHGGKVPAYNAVLINSIMARALEFDDAMAGGLHAGASAVPTGLAAAELAGGCSGKELLTALVVATEVAYRINSVSIRRGFDPTGTCGVFATAAIAGRVLRLTSAQMINALALAFSRGGGSYQSNIDSSLAVRLIQGFTAQSGVVCAELAQAGITGPKNFLEGDYGYFSLYARNTYDPKTVIGQLGSRFELTKTHFKKYPSCGLTQASIEAILDIIKEKHLTAEDVTEIDIKVTPSTHLITGRRFEIGDNPGVNAQFSIQYCVASALLRGSCIPTHFEESCIKDERIMDIVSRINVHSDPSLDTRGYLAVDMDVRTRQGAVHHKSLNGPSFYQGDSPTTRKQHLVRFQKCVDYPDMPLSQAKVQRLVLMVDKLEEVSDVRDLIPLLVV